MRASDLLLSLLLSGALAAPLRAQEPKPAGGGQAAAAPEPKLVFEREVFTFPTGGRRDPFTELTGKFDLGPRFEELSLLGIIYSPAGESMVLLSDGQKAYRKHRGEMVGNARVVQISPNRVIFSVDNFGVWREESLEMRKTPEGAKG